jgi:hypothetical protein
MCQRCQKSWMFPDEVGVVEVLRESEGAHLREADGHGRIAREVEEELQRVADGAGPGFGHARVRQRIDHVHHGRDGVGDEHLHAEADHEAARAEAELLQRVDAVLQVVLDLGVAHDRAGDELAEDGLVGRIGDEVAADRHGAAPDVDQVADGLQHIEGEADRQDDLRPGAGRQAEGGDRVVEGLHAEIRVFEIG